MYFKEIRCQIVRLVVVRTLLGNPMRITVFLFLLFLGEARADQCDHLPPPSVTLKRIESPVVVDTGFDYKSITVLSTRDHQPSSRVLGLTRGTARVGFELKGPMIVDRDRRWECVSPQIVMTYGFSPMTVYVAKEFPVGSCAYREIYQHEMRHVKTYQDHLLGIEAEIRESLTRRFATGAPMRSPVGDTRQRIDQEMRERWIPYIQREIERVRSAQALIDTPEEYQRVSDSCGGEIRRVIR